MNDAEKLIKYFDENNIDFIYQNVSPIYNHVGAIIVDSVLQAGLNYRTVVYPRVHKVIEKYATFSDVHGFIELINIFGLNRLINFNNKRKNLLIIEILNLMDDEGVVSFSDFQEWLTKEVNLIKLRELKGIGNKTIDYMKKLSGIDSIPMDRHLLNFLSKANINDLDYYKSQNIYTSAAKRLGVNLVTIDATVWNFMANRKALNISKIQ